MIKICYRDPNKFSPGLHAAAERHGRSTTVYLLSGLTATERRAALRRLRLSARMGHCPALPAVVLALALLTDRIRTGARHAGALFRSHPAGSTVPVMVVSAGAIAFLLLSPVSIRVLHQQRPAGPLSPAGPVPSVTAIAEPITGPPGRPGRRGSRTGQLTPAQAGSGGSAAFTAPAISGFGTSNPASSVGITSTSTTPGTSTPGTSTPSSSTPSSSTPSTSGSHPSPSDPNPSTGATSGSGAAAGRGNPAPAPTTTSSAPVVPAATPAPTSPPPPTGTTGSGSGVCLDLGPLGICL